METSAEVEASRSWLETLLNSSVDAIHIFDDKGRIIECSPSFLTLLGYTRGEALKLSLYDIEAQFSDDELDRIISGELVTDMTFETVLRKKDGTLIDVEISQKLININDAIYRYASGRDISRRKYDQIVLEQEKETAQNYLDIVNVMILVLDKEHKVDLINRRGCEIIGYEYDEVIGRDWVKNFLPTRTHYEITDVRDRLRKAEKMPSYYENPVLTKKGEERLIAWRNTPLYDYDGEYIGILASGEDITDIRKTQMQLRESHAFYQTIFASISEVIIILQNNCIIDCNESALSLLEQDKESLIGKNIADVFGCAECKEHSLNYYLDAAYAGKQKTVECSLCFSDGQSHSKIIEVNVSTFGWIQEEKLILVARDITKQIEEEKIFTMHTRQAQMGEMVSMIAHQWRQPLAIINAIVSQMRLKAILDDVDDVEYVDNLMKIETQSSHLSQTISDYRDFFRPDKPKEYFQVSMLIENALSLIDYALKSHSIEIQTKIVQNDVLYTHRNEVLQVLIVLLKNALDMFIEKKAPNGKIVITADHDETMYSISVYDNAGGIPPEIINKLFVPYFTTKNESYGTGLGLYMSKMIIEEHCGGNIMFFSQGNETTFTINLPYEKEDR